MRHERTGYQAKAVHLEKTALRVFHTQPSGSLLWLHRSGQSEALVFSAIKHDEDVLMAYEASRSQVQYAKQILYYKRVAARFLARNDASTSDLMTRGQTDHLTEDEFEAMSCMLEGTP
jgi:hypothetical protein